MSVPAVLSMLFFVAWTPYVGKTVLLILFLLGLKFVEYRVGAQRRFNVVTAMLDCDLGNEREDSNTEEGRS